MKQTYTVFAVHEDDNDQRYTVPVEATSPEEAERKAIREAPTSIIVAAVVEGAIIPAGRFATITPIKGRSFEATVARLTFEYVTVRLPARCPGCKADLRKVDALIQWDTADQVWCARIPRSKPTEARRGLPVNTDLGPHLPPVKHGAVCAFLIQCSTCERLVWNGLYERK